MWVEHEFPPFYNSNSEILILGTIPSPKSREQAFYYGHPQNRFWKVLAEIYNEALPTTIPEKKLLLAAHKLALWDVLAACEIDGAADTSIRNPIANNINSLLEQTAITRIFTTGGKAFELYNKLCLPDTGIKAEKLPSTSPANCATSLQKLVGIYRTALLL